MARELALFGNEIFVLPETGSSTHPGPICDGILTNSVLRSSQLILCLWNSWKTRLLWRTGSSELRVNRERGRSLHKRSGVFTGGFPGAVGVVGNRARFLGGLDIFSKSPETHRRDLENVHPCEGRVFAVFQPYFHFSCANYGNY